MPPGGAPGTTVPPSGGVAGQVQKTAAHSISSSHHSLILNDKIKQRSSKMLGNIKEEDSDVHQHDLVSQYQHAAVGQKIESRVHPEMVPVVNTEAGDTGGHDM